MSYLSERKMCVRFDGATSSKQSIPGGGPQGGLLTVILFNLQGNKAGYPCPLQKTLPLGVEGPEPMPVNHNEPAPLCHQTEKTLRKKYVDDLSLLEKVDLRATLVPMEPIIGPINLHEQPKLVLPPESSILQHQLDDLANFTSENKLGYFYVTA